MSASRASEVPASAVARSEPRAILGRIVEDAERLRGELDGLSRRPLASPEAVHLLHRDIRRWREDFRIVGPVLRANGSVDPHALRRRLGRFRRRVRAVRDRDVAADLAARNWVWEKTAAPGVRRRLVAQLAGAARRERRRLRRDPRISTLVHELAEYCSVLRASPSATTAQLPAESLRTLAAAEAKGKRTLRRLRRRPTIRRLHRHRVELRRIRDLGRTIDGGPVARVREVRSLRPWLRRLGELNDLAILESALRDAPGGGDAVARSVRRRRRAVREKIVRALDG